MAEKQGVLLIVALDTKEEEARYVEKILQAEGLDVHIMDPGILGDPSYKVSISRGDVANAAGTTLEKVRAVNHEGKAQAMVVEGAVKCALDYYEKGKIHGIISIGGSMGTGMGTAVMRAFPLGFPKMMVSTMASGNTKGYVGTKDILMLHSVCDISGLNTMLKSVLQNGAMAVAGMIKGNKINNEEKKPIIAMSSLGTTEACAVAVRKALVQDGYDVIVFHTNGTGGISMDELIRTGRVSAVLDLSLHENVSNRFGGFFDAGPERGNAALEMGVPIVFAPGNVDFRVGGPYEECLKAYPGRKVHAHNAAISAVRVSKEELTEMAGVFAEKWNDANGPVSVFLPTKGFSSHDSEKGHLYEPEFPPFLIEPLKKALNKDIPLHVLPYHINDVQFAEALIQGLKEVMAISKQ